MYDRACQPHPYGRCRNLHWHGLVPWCGSRRSLYWSQGALRHTSLLDHPPGKGRCSLPQHPGVGQHLPAPRPRRVQQRWRGSASRPRGGESLGEHGGVGRRRHALLPGPLWARHPIAYIERDGTVRRLGLGSGDCTHSHESSGPHRLEKARISFLNSLYVYDTTDGRAK